VLAASTRSLATSAESCRQKPQGTLEGASVNYGPVNTVPPIVHDVLRSPGQLPDPATRAFMEMRLGHDFSKVRVHTDARAARSARAVDALAYTVGRHVVFGSGQYSPETQRGRFLVAHELGYVLQQSGAAAPPEQIRLGRPHTRHEREAERAAQSVTSGARVAVTTRLTGVPQLQRQQAVFGDVRLAEARLEEEERLRLTTGCKNQAQAVARLRDVSRRYSGAVTIEVHHISQGDTLEGLTRATIANNTVHVYAHYLKEISDLNTGLDAGKIGNCVLVLRGWTDPAIGVLPAKPTGELPADAKRAIATVYAEQTRTTAQAQQQQTYIWYSMRMRLGLGLHGPTIDDVLEKGSYYGKGTADYNAALADLAKPSPTLAGVISARSVVLDNWDTPIPSDAGPFYFHWLRDSTAEGCFARKKDEKACAWEFANEHGIAGAVPRASGWHNKVAGDTPPPNDRIGSMYIYK